MRDQKAGVKQKDDKTVKSGIWLIVMLTGIFHAVSTIVVLYIVRSFTSQFGEPIFVPFIPAFALSFVFGVGIAIIGYMMYHKTTEQQR